MNDEIEGASKTSSFAHNVHDWIKQTHSAIVTAVQPHKAMINNNNGTNMGTTSSMTCLLGHSLCGANVTIIPADNELTDNTAVYVTIAKMTYFFVLGR